MVKVFPPYLYKRNASLGQYMKHNLVPISWRNDSTSLTCSTLCATMCLVSPDPFGDRARGRLFGGLCSYGAMVMNINVYVDGFNLYYGAVKNTAYKWLDVSALVKGIRYQDQINRIRYFTSLVDQRPDDPDKRHRQETYIRALETIPNLSVHYGTFVTHTVKRPIGCRHCSRPPTRPLACPGCGRHQSIYIVDTKEKGSDVNLGSFLLLDAFEQHYEMAVVMSNDSDLVTPIDIVQSRFKLPVVILNPQRNSRSAELRTVASCFQDIWPRSLRASLFPPTLQDREGKTITKPKEW